jgi:hypothetical protein
VGKEFDIVPAVQMSQCFFYGAVTPLLIKQWMILPKGAARSDLDQPACSHMVVSCLSRLAELCLVKASVVALVTRASQSCEGLAAVQCWLCSAAHALQAGGYSPDDKAAS